MVPYGTLPTGGLHGSIEQLSPGGAQMPQLALQHTWSELHRRPPQVAAIGMRDALLLQGV
jgi:hypothetical protein